MPGDRRAAGVRLLDPILLVEEEAVVLILDAKVALGAEDDVLGALSSGGGR